MHLKHQFLHGRDAIGSEAVSEVLVEQASVTYNASNPNPSIYPYTHDLNGVHISLDHILTRILWTSLGVVAAIILLLRLSQFGYNHLRRLFSMGAPSSRHSYYSRNHSTLWPFLKKHWLYAPLWKKRHNAEIKLSSAINIGTLPTRFHALLLFGYLTCNIIYFFLLDYGEKDKYAIIAELRGRSGTLAVVNMVPLFVLAGRNNPLIHLLRVSFDTYNLLHRWMGRMVVLDSVVHTICWLYNTVHAGGWELVDNGLKTNKFYTYGMVGTVGMIFLCLQSISPLRHAFYETFLHLHQIGVIVTMIGVWIHIAIVPLPQKPMMYAIFAIWGFDRTLRFFRILYLNVTLGGSTKAEVQALPSGCCRVTCCLPRNVYVEPGSHVYVYFPSFSLWMSHPFSIAWVEHYKKPQSKFVTREIEGTEEPKQLSRSLSKASTFSKISGTPIMDPPSPNEDTPTVISLLVAAREGMTKRLYAEASNAPDGKLTLSALVEGPYHVPNPLSSYGTVLLFAGGVGITHQLSHLQHLLTAYEEGTTATRRLILVWSVRHNDCLKWVRPWMNQVLALPHRREILRIHLFVTGDKADSNLELRSTTIHLTRGRPNVQSIIEREIAVRIGAMCVSVCGPGGLADDVRDGVRKWMGSGHGDASVDFIEEAFTW